jgi:hypothetical protein
MATWSILLPLGMFYGRLAYFLPFPKKKSGNSGLIKHILDN